VTDNSTDLSILILRLVLGAVLFMEAALLVFGPVQSFKPGPSATLEAVHQVLGWSEMIAALLFLVTRTLKLGSWLLLAVFVAAAVIHVAHGSFNVGPLLIYSAAVFVVMSHTRQKDVDGRSSTHETRLGYGRS
jgi:uncharacterized membrane protein YphA (DoxX/SURF4 family)